MPADLRSRFDDLIQRRNEESLTTEEYQGLLRLSDQIERFDARRVELLAELARHRGISLSQLLEQLQIAPECTG